jgi:hypothetical protein
VDALKEQTNTQKASEVTAPEEGEAKKEFTKSRTSQTEDFKEKDESDKPVLPSPPMKINDETVEKIDPSPSESENKKIMPDTHSFEKEPGDDTQRESAFVHQEWNDLLNANVSAGGKVNYVQFKADRSRLDAYLMTLSDQVDQKTWNRSQQMAYWINVYNAFTVKLIVDHYPINSIMDIYEGKPWDVKWIKLGNKTYSLNQIEHEILRPKFEDARIHFAVNCAAKSCPPLANRAYTESNLDSMLSIQTKKFINNQIFNNIQPGKISISKIFDWYKEDFADLIAFLNQYSDITIQKNAEIRFQEYDWKLNN